MWLSLWQDAIYALRGFRNNPVFAVLTLALGIGGTTAMFSVVRVVLLKPLDYPDADRLVNISEGATPTRYDEIRVNTQSLGGVGAFVGAGLENLTLTGGSEPQILKGARVSANFLSVLGRRPILGRSFQPSDDSVGGPPVALISEELWSWRFRRDPQISGKTIVLYETPYTVVGVMPARFQFPFPEVDVWLSRPSEWPLMAASSRQLSPFLTLFARLRPNVTLGQANADLALMHRRYAAEYPAMLDAKSKSPVEVKPMKDALVTNVRAMLWMLFGAVGLVLMITCANVASLMLVRARSRSREFSVRAALGASASRLLSQLLAESLLLSLTGGLLGVMLAWGSLRAIPMIKSIDLPQSGEIRLDWVVLLFACGVSVGTGILFGLAPAWRASQPDLTGGLRDSGSALSDGHGFRTRGLLLVAQVAFSIILMIGAMLMIQSVSHLRDVPVGFNPANLITAQIELPLLRYGTAQKRAAFFEELLARIDLSPGIKSSTAAMTLPMGGYAGSPIQDAAKPRLKLNERPITTICVVTPGYFRTLQIPLRRGRDFSEQDRDGAERVAIIDEVLARRFWPQYPAGLNPVGQQLFVGGVNPNPARIVGIVAAVHQTLEATPWPETVYVSFAQGPQATSMLAVRTDADSLGSVSVVRNAVQRLDRNLALSEVHSMDELVDSQLGKRQVVVTLLASFATVSVALALIGIYGSLSYAVTQRVRELAIRSAIGAQKSDILRLVLEQVLGLTMVGIVIGLAGSFWLTELLKKLLFGVSATDPATFVGVGILFLLAALLAGFIPALRATRINPMAALRV